MHRQDAALLSKRPGPSSKLDDPVYRKKLIALYKVETVKEVARLLGTGKRTVERHMSQLRKELALAGEQTTDGEEK